MCSYNKQWYDNCQYLFHIRTLFISQENLPCHKVYISFDKGIICSIRIQFVRQNGRLYEQSFKAREP